MINWSDESWINKRCRKNYKYGRRKKLNGIVPEWEYWCIIHGFSIYIWVHVHTHAFYIYIFIYIFIYSQSPGLFV